MPTEHAHAWRWAGALASPKLSAAFFVVTAACALWTSTPGRSATLAMLVPFSLLTVNLLAAICTNRRFRTDLPLLVFHLALLAFVVILLWARLTYFDGQATVSAGMDFDGELVSEQSGPLHDRRIETLRFTNLGFTENFAARGQLNATYNRVRWQGEDGTAHTADIGDDIPLLLSGYRIYTSRFRGFSPVLRWQTADGGDEWGTVQLRESNNNAFAGANDWILPNGQPAWLMVDFEVALGKEGESARPNLGAGTLPHRLVLRVADERHTLAPGDRLALEGGTLTYVRLGSWMGYRFVSDPTQSWLLGCVTLAVLSLVWFYARVVFRPISAPSNSL